ncbi:MAG: MtrB/PioB family decaheme-associated outer membrane protein [Rhodospirillaceae bacterium]|nr:MtrB/PioB family decaheme-associated outer membrane protein [Rhodospirillales bacterium]
MIKKLAIALSTTMLIPFAALADDDEFGIAQEPVAAPAKTYLNYIEVGGGYSSDNPLKANRYSGRSDDGVFPVGSLSYLYRTPYDVNGADFMRVNANSYGYDSRRLTAEGGQQGLYALNFGYDLMPFSSFRGLSAWTGEGGDILTKVPGWTGNVSSANLPKRTPVDIRTERERFGSGLTWHVDPLYSVRINARHEQKEGLRSLGVYSNGVAGSRPGLNVPAPVNYQDDQVEAELGFAGKQTQWKLGYNLSMFRNEDSSLTLNSVSGDAAHPRDRMSLAPSNTAHSFYADGGYQFTDTTRLVTNLSYSQYLQDDTFLPYSINGTPAALPRQSLDGRISTTTANVELTSRPLPRLDTKTRYRFTDRRNDTAVSQFNYYTADSTAQSGILRRNTPFSYKENLAGLDLGYALTPRTKLMSGYEFRQFQRSHSERAKNIDNTTYVGVRSSLAEGLTSNAKYSRMWRDGSTYSPTGSLVYTNAPGFAVYDNNPGLRKYYEADMIRDRIQAGFNYSPVEAWTLGASGGLVIDEYVRSDLGLTDSVATTATVDANYVASPEFSMTGFYTYERRVTDQAGEQATLAQVGDVSRRWFVNIAEDAHTVGLGSVWQIREGWKLLTDYAFVWTVTETDPTRNSANVTGLASSFPDITSKSHSISARAEYDLTDNVVIGFGYALEIYRSKDWALDGGLNQTPTTGLMTLSEQSPNYDAHLFLLTTRAKF